MSVGVGELQKGRSATGADPAVVRRVGQVGGVVRADVLLITAGDIAIAARLLRDIDADTLAEIPPEFLRRASHHLRAGAYSAQTAARRMDSYAAHAEEQRARRRAECQS